MMEQNRSNSYLFGGNAPYVEEMYEAYLENPGSVPDTWRAYFDALQHVPAADGSDARDVPHAPVIESFAQRAKANAFAVKASSTDLAIARNETIRSFMRQGIYEKSTLEEAQRAVTALG